MSCSKKIVKSHMLFTCKHFKFSDYTLKKFLSPGNRGNFFPLCLRPSVRNLNISRWIEFDFVTENIADLNLKAIFKYKDPPSILALHSNCEKETFRSSEVNIEDIKNYTLKLDKNKTSQHSDIPIKIIKEKLDIFPNFLCINISFKLSLFPFYLKKTDVTPLHKKKEGIENYRPR